MIAEYQGEQLFFGGLGRFLTVFFLVSSLFATLVYYFSVQAKDPLKSATYRRWARGAFIFQCVSVFSILALLFFLILSNKSEYYYVWRHSEPTLPLKYIVSSLWEGQEGSFLLWAFWHSILGLVLIWKAGKWEAPVMAVMSAAQVVIATMILGVTVLGFKIGNNPFVLLREVQAQHVLNIYPDYAQRFDVSGNGLNTLLQNYWMVIHPPTLFLGFASTIVPFAFGIAALWTRKYKEWVKPALPWTLFSVMVLGTGIIMGAAWAYEALSFGGFWAWDPVENASLVPWLTLVAGLHTLVIYRATKRSFHMTIVLLSLTFLGVLYSTYLTRSGDLGDSSVHSFTDDGLRFQLAMFIFLFALPAIGLLIKRWKEIPKVAKEEKNNSREFWLFMGSLVFLVSALHISFSTSVPVFKNIANWFSQLFGQGRPFAFAGPEGDDAIPYYNAVQIWIAILIGFLAGAIQFSRYLGGKEMRFWKRISPPLILSLLFCILLAVGFSIQNFAHLLLLWSSLFAIVGNLWFVFSVLRFKLPQMGGSISHIGFGLMLLGILISASKKKPISINRDGIILGEEFTMEETMQNIFLPLDSPKLMPPYEVTYVGDSSTETEIEYRVDYKRFNKAGEVVETFSLFPYVQLDDKQGPITNPDTRHYFDRDIYTYVAHSSDFAEENTSGEARIVQFNVDIGDTMRLAMDKNLVLKSVSKQEVEGEPGAKAIVEVLGSGLRSTIEPAFYFQGDQIVRQPAKAGLINSRVDFFVRPNDEKKYVFIVEEVKLADNWIVLKALVFPFINILWLGAFVMVVGVFLSMFYRLRKKRKRQDG